MPSAHASDTITIGCGAGFWGDTETAAGQLLRTGRLDYLVFDYLAEVTMSIMAGARMRRPDGGHAHDFVSRVMRANLDLVVDQGVKVVTNAGGVNPLACRDALRALAVEMGHTPKIAVVLGDDLMPQREALAAQGVREMTSGAPLPAALLSMNAYLGAAPIAAALAAGADIVLTGRVVDSALVLAPLMHGFGWGPTDYDLLSAGSLAGHIVECGAQATGGLFTDWEQVDYRDVGFPIVECHADGSFILDKPQGTTGLVSPAVVHEQLVYEIGDPRAYQLPDVTCDWTEVHAATVAPGRVRITGALGHPPPATYKVSATHMDGFRTGTAMLVTGRDAGRKAAAVGDALLAKTADLLESKGMSPLSEICMDVLGCDTTYGRDPRAPAAGPGPAPREAVLRIAVRHPDAAALKLMLRELSQAGTGMAPGFAGALGGRPGAQPVIRLFSCLIDPARLSMQVDIDGTLTPVARQESTHFDPASLPPQALNYEAPDASPAHQLPLWSLAHGRSGDKGPHSNVGILARDPAYLPYIGAALSETAVAEWMSHVLDPVRGRVRRWALPGCNGLNFLLEHSLGGGGFGSLRADPLGKGHAQQLLHMPVPVSPTLYARLGGDEEAAR